MGRDNIYDKLVTTFDKFNEAVNSDGRLDCMVINILHDLVLDELTLEEMFYLENINIHGTSVKKGTEYYFVYAFDVFNSNTPDAVLYDKLCAVRCIKETDLFDSGQPTITLDNQLLMNNRENSANNSNLKTVTFIKNAQGNVYIMYGKKNGLEPGARPDPILIDSVSMILIQPSDQDPFQLIDVQYTGSVENRYGYTYHLMANVFTFI